jgi:hypothetical protein
MGVPLYWSGSDHEQAQPRPPAGRPTKSPGGAGAEWSTFRPDYFFSPQQPELDSVEQQEPAELSDWQPHGQAEQQPQHFFQAT